VRKFGVDPIVKSIFMVELEVYYKLKLPVQLFEARSTIGKEDIRKNA
jgi:hypothetical protein